MIALGAHREIDRRLTSADGREFIVRSELLSRLEPADFERWASLAEHSLEPNPFLAPGFVTALCRNLVDPDSVIVLIVADSESREWLAAGVFRESAVTSRSPLMYLESLRSDYTFLDGMLCDREQAGTAIAALLKALSAQRRWHGLRFRMLHADSPFARRLHTIAGRQGIVHFSRGETERAVISLDEPLSLDALLAACSKSRRKKLRRARRALDAMGEVRFELVAPIVGVRDFADEFLHLERLGWKGDTGTALAHNADSEAFFRETVLTFSKTRDVWFGRLLLNGRTIASTCNFRAGSTLYAFKIGWDPEFEAGMPGFWSELELACAAPRFDPSLERIDSCATPGSYVESIWPHRRTVCFESYVWSRRARVLGTVREHLCDAKRLVAATR